jgi:hypothetical protein
MAKYESNKKYQWNNEDQIVISGRDFGLFLNTFRAILSTDLAASVFMAAKANDAVEHILEEYVEKDVIKEVTETQNPVK